MLFYVQNLVIIKNEKLFAAKYIIYYYTKTNGKFFSLICDNTTMALEHPVMFLFHFVHTFLNVFGFWILFHDCPSSCVNTG